MPPIIISSTIFLLSTLLWPINSSAFILNLEENVVIIIADIIFKGITSLLIGTLCFLSKKYILNAIKTNQQLFEMSPTVLAITNPRTKFLRVLYPDTFYNKIVLHPSDSPTHPLYHLPTVIQSIT